MNDMSPVNPEGQALAARRERAIDIMASWALEGMHPAPKLVEDINAYVEGELTTADLIERAKAGDYVG